MSAIRSFFQEMLYAIPTLSVMDVVDILVVAFIIYKVMLLIRSTSASRVARSILLLLIVIVTYAQKAVEKWLENRSSGVTK